MLINEKRKFGKIISKEKETLSKKTEELQKRSNTASQPSNSLQPTQDQNQRYASNCHPDKKESYDQFNKIQSKNFKRYHYQPYKKRYYQQKSSTYHHTHYQDCNYCY